MNPRPLRPILSSFRSWRFSQTRSRVWNFSNHETAFSNSSFKIDVAGPRGPTLGQPFEEETLPGYEPAQFYPIHVGEELNSHYRIIGKLGFGANSTVWLGRDRRNDTFVAVKVYVRTPANLVHREQNAYAHLSSLSSSLPSREFIRQLLDSFYISQPDGSHHLCLIFEPLHSTLQDLQMLGGSPQPLPEDLVKEVLQNVLQAMDFLHVTANMIHCDLKMNNIMLRIEDQSVLHAFEEAERTSPAPGKIVDAKRIVYASRKLRHPQGHAFGPPVLCDFGEARIGSSFPYTNIQPDLYKAPEVLLMLDWNQKADIWNLACLVWDMMQAKHLFRGRDDEGFHNNRVHIGEMVGLLGHPPLDFQQRSSQSWRVFDAEGKWKGDPPLSQSTLEDRDKLLAGTNKAEFLSFMRSMLCWRPEERRSARELLHHPWMRST